MTDEETAPSADETTLLKRGIIEDARPILAKLDYSEERRRLARRRLIRRFARWLLRVTSHERDNVGE